MAQQIINIGNAPDDGKGDKLRPAFQKVNANFTELYTAGGLANSGVVPGSYTSANLTVNAQGLLTAASNGSGGGSGGLTNINSILPVPLNPDGVTSNVPMLLSLAPLLQSVGPEMPVPVVITVGSPTVLSLDPTVASGGTYPTPAIHFLKPNQSFYFIQRSAGSLPSGISLNTPYYITSANLTATTFTFSTVNNYGWGAGYSLTSEGSPVNTTGSFTGTFSIVLTGRDINLLIPPGAYFGGNYGDPTQNLFLTPNGITRIRYFAYGAMFDTKVSFGTTRGSTGSFGDAATWDATVFDHVDTTPTQTVAPPGFNGAVTLVTPAHISRYFVGQWVSVIGLNIQDAYNATAGGNSGPPNAQYQEFKRIIAVDAGAGTITLDGTLRRVYLSTFPKMIVPNSVFVMSGAAAIVPMHPSWDTEVEIRGARWIGQPGLTAARRVLYEDCVFQGFGDYPSQAAMAIAQSYIYRNCRFGPSMPPIQTYMEVDKWLEYFELDRCVAYNKYHILFQSPSFQVGVVKNHQGSVIEGTPRHLKISDSILDGILIGPYLGVSDTVQIYNTHCITFDMLNRTDDNNAPVGPSIDMTLVPNWSFSNGTFTRNISSVPGGQAMNWQIPGAKFYMTDAGQVYKYYQNMGAPFAILNTYMDGSGNFSFDTTLSAVPTRQTSHAATISIASPAVVTWTAHGLPANTPVVWTTTGALPTGLSVSTPYYVMAAGLGANTFQLSATVGGAAINTSGTQSGAHTAWGNPLCFRPHPCPRFTSIGNSGCNTIIDQNGSVDEPLFSRVKRGFVGKQSNQGGNSIGLQAPNPRIWGFLKSMTVNVRKAGTASGTLNIGCPGFTQPNLALANFSQTIDTTVAGVRSWTGSAAPTGSAGADAIAAYADWVAGPLVFTWSTGVTLPNSPIVEFEMVTDQGITRFGNMMGAPGTPSAPDLWQWADSGIVQQYNSLP